MTYHAGVINQDYFHDITALRSYLRQFFGYCPKPQEMNREEFIPSAVSPFSSGTPCRKRNLLLSTATSIMCQVVWCYHSTRNGKCQIVKAGYLPGGGQAKIAGIGKKNLAVNKENVIY